MFPVAAMRGATAPGYAKPDLVESFIEMLLMASPLVIDAMIESITPRRATNHTRRKETIILAKIVGNRE